MKMPKYRVEVGNQIIAMLDVGNDAESVDAAIKAMVSAIDHELRERERKIEQRNDPGRQGWYPIPMQIHRGE
jgi:hypothetical protein